MGTILVPPKGEPVACAECSTVMTHEDVKADKLRLYKRNGRYLCELCAEEEIERGQGDDDSI